MQDEYVGNDTVRGQGISALKRRIGRVRGGLEALAAAFGVTSAFVLSRVDLGYPSLGNPQDFPDIGVALDRFG